LRGTNAAIGPGCGSRQVVPGRCLIRRAKAAPDHLPGRPLAWIPKPVLYGDRLVGKLDATADRKAGLLRVNAIHQDVTFDKTMTAVDHEIEDLAYWLGLDLLAGRS
jgi:hypothetical protein